MGAREILDKELAAMRALRKWFEDYGIRDFGTTKDGAFAFRLDEAPRHMVQIPTGASASIAANDVDKGIEQCLRALEITHHARKLSDEDEDYMVYDFITRRLEYTNGSIRPDGLKWRIFDREKGKYFDGCPWGLKAEYNDPDVCATAVGQCLLNCKNCPKEQRSA